MSVFEFTAPSLRTVIGASHGIAHINAANIIRVGILLLIPIQEVRAVFCMVGFTRQRDLPHIAISATVSQFRLIA
jgi:uncharacterized membrane protein